MVVLSDVFNETPFPVKYIFLVEQPLLCTAEHIHIFRVEVEGKTKGRNCVFVVLC